MKIYNSVEKFKTETFNDPLSFEFLNKNQGATFEILKKITKENIINKPSKTRRFSLILYGSSGTGKTFIIKNLLKWFEKNEKLKPEEYFYCEIDYLRQAITKKHDKMMYEYYKVDVIDNIIVKILKEQLYKKDKKLVIFDDLNEDIFFEVDFTAADFLYNRNGKGVFWILTKRSKYNLKINKKDLYFVELDDISTSDLEIFKDRYFRNFDIIIGNDVKNIKDLLKRVEREGKIGN